MADDFIIRLDLDVRDAEQSAKQLLQVVERLQKEFGNDSGLRKATKGISEFGIATGKTADKQQSAAAAAKAHAQGLSTTRYALYDVSATLAVVGAAMIALTAATYGAAIAYERDFANVIRTSGVTGEAVDELRRDFVALGQDIPVALSKLSEIGTLGGQLGIAASDLGAFTSVVARFSAVTDLSVEKAATAFGRLKALLPDVADGTYDLEQLASSILKVGVNSVATESDITNIATQLSSMAGYAGLSADELIGLSGALASVGTQPELARGTITRLFTQMGKAVSANGDTLKSFARTAGVSADEFASSFGTNRFGPIFLKFVEGLGNISAGGGDAVQALNELGITSVRDVPALTRLATAANSAGEAGGLLAQTMGDAAKGIAGGTELTNQYGVIAATVSAKLQVLVQNFQLLLVTIGDGGSVFGGFIDVLVNVLKALTNLASNPVTNFFLQATLLVAGFIGVAALIGGVAARAYAGMIAMTQALIGMTGASAGASVSLGTIMAQLAATGPLGKKAAAGVMFLVNALRLLSVIGIALALPEIGNWATDTVDQMRGVSHEVDDIFERFMRPPEPDAFLGRGGIQAIAKTKEAIIGFNRGLGDISSGNWGDLKRLDEGLRDLVQNGNITEAKDRFAELKKEWLESGGTMAGFRAAFPDVINALKESSKEARKTGDSTQKLAEDTLNAEIAMDGLATSLGLTTDELAGLIKNFSEGSAAFVDYGDLIQRVQDQTKGFAEKASRDAYGSADSWQKFYDGSSVNIHDFMELLDQQIANQEAWATDLSVLTARGATAFVAELAKMGPEGAPLAKAAVDLSVDELNKLEDQARLAAFLGSTAYAETWAEQNAILAQVMEQGGIEAVKGMIAAQREEAVSGVPGAVAAFVQKWNSTYGNKPIKMPVYTDTSPAVGQITKFIRDYSGRAIPLYVTTLNAKNGRPVNVGQFAGGGSVRGPGTGTSDSIPARLSHGEYVIRAASVRKYGMGIFDQLNRGVARFASGGPVSRRGSNGAGSGSGIMELGPHSLNRLGGQPQVNVFLTDEAIARAANRGNKKIVAAGGRP